jgi:putative ABC transport system permease protein
MLTHSLKQIIRSLWKYKSFSIINLLGLSIGIAVVTLIFMIADYEKVFDQFHENGKDIYRIVNKAEKGGKEQYEATIPYPTAKFLRNEYPGLQGTQIHFSEDANVRIGNQSPFTEKNIVFADSLFFNVFDFSGIKKFQAAGNVAKALSAPNKVILTEGTARRYFGSANPIGQVLRLDARLDLEVAAIVKDPPATTHLPFSMLVSFSSLTNDYIGGLDLNSWNFTGNGYCYVRLDAKSSIASVEKALHSIVQKNRNSDANKNEKYYLQSLAQIHFQPDFDTTNPSYTVSEKYLTMLLLLGGFIILIACVNYINLSTSLAFSKSKEVGIRKTIGASKLQLFFHYMSETLFLTLVAAAIGLMLAVFFLPVLNRLLDKSISIEQLAHFKFIAGAILGLLMVSFISGVYPALILAGFKPIESLKNQLAMPGKASTLLRKALVVFQFTTSIALIICTLVIAKQMHYFNTKSLGFKKDAVVEVELPSPDSTKIEAFRSSLQNQVGVQAISFCLGAPISNNGISTSMKAPELPEKSDYNVKILACDKNYLETYGIQLIAGRWFFEAEEKDLGSGLVVNESLIKTLGYKHPSEALGKKLAIGINNYNPPIIGVVKDFHTSSLHQSIGAVALMPFPYFYFAAGVRINPSGLRNTLSAIESAYKKVYPDYVYSVNFIDEQLAKLYEQETRNYNLFKAFSAVSVFICCIGLWGLIAFVVVRKTKEIGVRKILGASIQSIVALLSKDFLRLVLIALVVASPVAWYFMHQWLENFAYRIRISWAVFVLAGGIALFITLVTISFQAIRAALANPVKNLRTE